jgi:hypothetical protein
VFDGGLASSADQLNLSARGWNMATRLARLVVLTLLGVLAGLLLGVAPASAGTSATVATTVRLTGNWMVHKGSSTTVTATVSTGSGHTAYLQVQVSSTAWQTLKTAKVAASGSGGKVTVKFVPAKPAAVYRVVATKGAVRAVSNTLTIRTTSYGPYLGKAQYYMKNYCPSTPLTATLNPEGSLAGLATTRWSVWREWDYTGRITATYSWSQKIDLRTGMPDDVLKAVALHECGHIVQYRQLVKGQAAFEAKLTATDKIYNGNGIEKQADCMAAVVLGTMKYAYYTKSCNAAQRSAAAALWRDYGKKYQSAHYTFVRTSS